MKKFLVLSITTLSVLLFLGCEGPAGVDGIDGVDGQDGAQGPAGADGNVTCLSCHNNVTQEVIATEFAASQHSSGAIAVDYAGGRSYCAECHSHEGFLEFALTGDVAADIANPSAWECSTCHAIHTDFAADDYAFRLGDAVTLIADGTTVVDGANNNICLNCHQSRRNVGYYDKYTADTTFTRTFTGDDIAVYQNAAVGPGGSKTLNGTGDTLTVVFDVPTTYAYISSTHAGPHHSAQGNVWQGLGGVTDGTPYAAHDGGCVECHMGPESGHSFWPEEGNCMVTGCHTSSKESSLDAFAVRVAAAAEALEGLHAIHLDDADNGYVYGNIHPVYASLPKAEFNAWWNFMVLLEDRSRGAHNPTYFETLLTSIETDLGL